LLEVVKLILAISYGPNPSTNKILKPGKIVQNLRSCGFLRSLWHKTVGKLQKLQRLSIKKYGNLQKYHGYLEFFADLHKSAGLPSKLFTLILPEAQDLMDMDLTILKTNVSVIRENFMFGKKCDLSELPTRTYPGLRANFLAAQEAENK